MTTKVRKFEVVFYRPSTSEPTRRTSNVKAQVGDKLKVYYGPAQSESKVKVRVIWILLFYYFTTLSIKLTAIPKLNQNLSIVPHLIEKKNQQIEIECT